MGRSCTCHLPLRSRGWVLSQMTGMIIQNNNTHYGPMETFCEIFHTLRVLCRLNLPTCLPDVYIHLKDPQPVSRKKYTAINREHLCKGINCVEVDSDPHIDLHAWYWVLLQVSCTFVQCKQQTKVVVLELMLNVGQFPVWICMYDCKATTQLPKTTVWLPLIDLSACFPFAAYAVQS